LTTLSETLKRYRCMPSFGTVGEYLTPGGLGVRLDTVFTVDTPSLQIMTLW